MQSRAPPLRKRNREKKRRNQREAETSCKRRMSRCSEEFGKASRIRDSPVEKKGEDLLEWTQTGFDAKRFGAARLHGSGS